MPEGDKTHGKNTKNSSSTSDIYRDTPLRYAGIAHVIADAICCLLPPYAGRGAYFITTGYICADIIDKAGTVHNNNEGFKRTLLATGDALLWQTIASIWLPAFVVNRTAYLAGCMLRYAKCRKCVSQTVSPILGVAILPFVMRPIDKFVTTLMDDTYRKYIGDYRQPPSSKSKTNKQQDRSVKYIK